jgi:hypothetical protein
VWNLLFSQGKYAQQRGVQLNLTAVGPRCTTSVNECPRYRYHARRSREIFQIWASVFGPELRRTRLRFVLGSWTISPAASREMLAFEDTYRWVDHLGITGYLASVSRIDSTWSVKTIPQVRHCDPSPVLCPVRKSEESLIRRFDAVRRVRLM